MCRSCIPPLRLLLGAVLLLFIGSPLPNFHVCLESFDLSNPLISHGFFLLSLDYTKTLVTAAAPQHACPDVWACPLASIGLFFQVFRSLEYVPALARHGIFQNPRCIKHPELYKLRREVSSLDA